MTHEKSSAQTSELTLPRTASYLGLAAVFTIALGVHDALKQREHPKP